MRAYLMLLCFALAALVFQDVALADQEASNVAHVASGPYGRCYAKSVPAHVYDPVDGPRQQGQTSVYRVARSRDVLLHRFDWFSQRIFLSCRPGDDTVVVRVGAWHRGHNPSADHLALAFYKGGKLIRRYSTLDVSGSEKAVERGLSEYQNVSPSKSHYTVFRWGPEMIKTTENTGAVFHEKWTIRATTVDGRVLVFDMATGDTQ